METKRRPPRIFLRDDDVGALTPSLRRFAATFEERGLPVSYQIIPRLLTDECARFLRDAKRRAPKLLELSQHGLAHEMNVGGRKVYYEFGPERSYDEQLEDIRAGRGILEDKLADDFEGLVFTPPQHKYDRSTLRALENVGVRVLSASCYSGWAHRAIYRAGRTLGLSSIGRRGISYHGQVRPDADLLELSISVVVDDGSTHRERADQVLREIRKACAQSPVVGLMFHHEVYQCDGDAAFLTHLADGLAAMRGGEFSLLSDIYRSAMKQAG